MKVKLALAILLGQLAFVAVKAHDGHKSKKQDSSNVKSEHHQDDTPHHHNDEMKIDHSSVNVGLNDFPTLHPLIVHFAIVLIIVAAILQLVNVILAKKEFAWIVTGLLLTGVLAAWLSGRNFHPHTNGVNEHVKLILGQHDLWAERTINTGFIALILQVANLFLFKSKRPVMVVIAVVVMASAFSVAKAGHYGAQLVHIEGIGPQGKYLEMDHHH